MRTKTATLTLAALLGLAAPTAAHANNGLYGSAEGAALHRQQAVAARGLDTRTTLGRTGEETSSTLGAKFAAAVHEAAQGGTDPAVAAVAPTSAPTITAPASGATVSGVTTFSATSTADLVRFSFDSSAYSVTAQVVGGVASVDVDTFGMAEGTRQVDATGCDTAGNCGPLAGPVTFTVANGTPAITQPATGTRVGATFVAVASTTGGLLRFLLDSQPVAEVAAPPYQASISTAGLAAGSHELQAERCTADKALCEPLSAPVTVNVVAVSPSMSPLSPDRISPNGDGLADQTTVRYSLDQPDQVVTWSVLDSAGTVVRGPVRLGHLGTGAHSFVFNGQGQDKAPLRSGGYRVRVESSVAVSGDTVTGSAERSLVVDLRKPTASAVRASLTTFYPAKDAYKDTTVVSASVSEPLSSLKLLIRNTAGRLVRTINAGSAPAGTNRVTWNGRTASGAVVPAGSYRAGFVLRDTVGNAAKSGTVTVTVSGKKLVKSTKTTVVVPKPSVTRTVIGSCSEVQYPARADWPGSLAYLSDYNVCWDPSAAEEVAMTQHTLRLPAAARYGNIRVSAYGAKDLAEYNDIAVVMYQQPNGDLSDYGVDMLPAARWYTGDTVKGADFVTGRAFRWWAGTSLGYYYDIKSFSVTYSWFVLR